jgi:hypothetical protein
MGAWALLASHNTCRVMPDGIDGVIQNRAAIDIGYFWHPDNALVSLSVTS